MISASKYRVPLKLAQKLSTEMEPSLTSRVVVLAYAWTDMFKRDLTTSLKKQNEPDFGQAADTGTRCEFKPQNHSTKLGI
ncbi:hypothetical protein EGR_07963 [Echinococcus granulosus]|uniref:Uncharacterized protein n=1 Tax=Echinococcus granulosus TaxID=6210 RepID=W6U9F4_ECHGR|nr:hypothetical protein EGR_07963 [Echinococcus granulosus]EUB57146.1 hypothetical protein EGR_07963 [Echinococcus granulosus]